MRSAAAAAFLFIAMPLAAATFTVSQNTDDGTGSFRWAILGANAAPGPDTIVFSQYPMTIRLSAPLPPITDELAMYPVDFGATVVIDGSSAGDADGLVVNASAVHVEGLALINFTGDGLVVNGDNGEFRYLNLSNDRNGARVAGRNNALYGSKIEKNRAAGVWVTSEASGNVISQYDPGPNQLVPWLPSRSDIIAGNRDGIVLDGIQNTVLGATITSDKTVPPNSGAGVVVNGAHNWVVQSEITGNGGNGITLNVPGHVSQTTGSCNGGPLIAGSSEPAPRLTSAVHAGSATTVDGTLDALPKTQYRIELFDADPGCSAGATTFRDMFWVSTDAQGHWTFDHTSEMSGVNVVATATREVPIERNSSPLSAPLPVTVSPNPAADVAITVTGPSAAIPGGLVTFNMTMTNRGPAPASYVGLSYTFQASLLSRTSGVDCEDSLCRATVLGVGESKTFPITFRVVGQMPRFDFTAYARLSSYLGVPDPDLSNNTATVSVAVESKTRAVRH